MTRRPWAGSVRVLLASVGRTLPMALQAGPCAPSLLIPGPYEGQGEQPAEPTPSAACGVTLFGCHWSLGSDHSLPCPWCLLCQLKCPLPGPWQDWLQDRPNQPRCYSSSAPRPRSFPVCSLEWLEAWTSWSVWDRPGHWPLPFVTPPGKSLELSVLSVWPLVPAFLLSRAWVWEDSFSERSAPRCFEGLQAGLAGDAGSG